MYKKLIQKDIGDKLFHSSLKGFLMMEIVLALMIIGVALGMLAHFYFTRAHSVQIDVHALDTIEEQALFALDYAPAMPYSIVSDEGIVCKGEMYSTTLSQSTFKRFIPKTCEKSATLP